MRSKFEWIFLVIAVIGVLLLFTYFVPEIETFTATFCSLFAGWFAYERHQAVLAQFAEDVVHSLHAGLLERYKLQAFDGSAPVLSAESFKSLMRPGSETPTA